MKITLESGQFGWDYLIVAEDGRDRLIQTDYDYPGTASTFGWSPSKVPSNHCHHVEQDADHGDECGCSDETCPDYCEHDGTDGTVDCDCGVRAGVFIQSAREWLDDHIGDEAEDPGYFGDEGEDNG